jgi:ATP-binding cassette, subfamily F, member 3
MDEPTTHLDMRSIEALIGALGQYAATLVFVSHDLHFIRSVATSVLHVRQGEIKFYPGGYDYFIEKTASTDADAGSVEAVKSSERNSLGSPTWRQRDIDRKRREAEERQQRYRIEQQLRARLRETETRILDLEQRQEQLVAALQAANGSTADLSLELKQVTDELGVLMPEWEQLVELMKTV